MRKLVFRYLDCVLSECAWYRKLAGGRWMIRREIDGFTFLDMWTRLDER